MFIRSIPAFPVHDIDAAVRFYKDKMKFECDYKNTGFAKLTRGHVELHLWAASDRSWLWRSVILFLKPVISGAESFIPGTHSCRIEVSDVEQLYEELKKEEVLHKSKYLIEVTDWNTKEFHALDLHGNLLTFYETLSQVR